MSNSLKYLLETMAEGPVTQGWGALAVYSRSRLNRLLEQQYVTRLQDNSYLPAFSHTLTGAGVGDAVSLDKLEFGAPLLSFINASLGNSKATLTLNIIKGSVNNAGGSIGSFEITEALGYRVQMELDLELVRGEVDPYGRVALNLAKGVRFSSNLFEDNAELTRQLVTALETWMVDMPDRCSMFELGTVSFSGYGQLAPTNFVVRTQAAPGSRVRNARNYGDGAVVVCIRVRGISSDGLPPDESFPYLLPDGDYSATVVVSHELRQYADNGCVDILAQLLFPGLNVFVQRSYHEPLDLVFFGNIEPMRTSLTVKPTMGAVVTAGQTQQFDLYDGNDNVIRATRWSAINPYSHDDAGHGRIDSYGRYQAPSAQDMGQEVLTVIIKAEYEEGGLTYHAAARALVISEPILAMPAVGAYRPQQHSQGIGLWNAGKDDVRFEMLGEQLGQIAYLDNGRSRFVPKQGGRRVIGVQQLQAGSVQAGPEQAGHSALVLEYNQPLVSLDPPNVPRLGYGESTGLGEVNRIMPNEPRRWRMLAGPGRVTAQGQFTASGLHIAQPNVVTCEVVRNGVVFAAGYSVVKETDVKATSTWVSLQRFTLTVGKNSGGTVGAINANGFQQLEVQLTVETNPVDGKDYKLSPTELASMGLFDYSRQKIAELHADVDGISSADGQVWRVKRSPNRFVSANQSLMTPDGPAQAPATALGAEERTDRVELYLHRRGATTSQVFFAGFKKDDGEWFYSNSTDHNNATIEVQVRQPQHYKDDDYSFRRTRVAGGGGDQGGADPESADFDLHPVTDDYWSLDYAKGTFYTAEFVKANKNDSDLVNTSMVRWESSYASEWWHSYTGYIFQNQGAPKPTRVSFDCDLGDVLDWLDYPREVSSQYQAGRLVIANFRNRTSQLGKARNRPSFERLSRPLLVDLRDEQGNLHSIQIDYLPADTIGDRNVLVHSVPSRPTSGDTSIIRLTHHDKGTNQ